MASASDPIQDINNKSRSLGRKNNEKNQMLIKQRPEEIFEQLSKYFAGSRSEVETYPCNNEYQVQDADSVEVFEAKASVVRAGKI